MLSLQSATLAFSGPAAVPAQARAQTQMAAIDDLKVIAKEQVRRRTVCQHLQSA